jgi:hypothetical protein
MEPPQPSGAPMGGQLGIPPPSVVPLVLQVFPLPGLTDWEEFFYNRSPNTRHGPFAAAHAFFLEQGHKRLSTTARISLPFKRHVSLVPHFALSTISLLVSSPRVIQSFNSWLLLQLLPPLTSLRRLPVTLLAMGPGPSPAPNL